MIDSMPVTVSGRNLPSFTLRQEDLASLGFWDVNSKHYLVLKVELVSKNNAKAMGADGRDDGNKIEGRFQIMMVKPIGDKPIDAKTLEQQDMERVVAEARSSAVR